MGNILFFLKLTFRGLRSEETVSSPPKSVVFVPNTRSGYVGATRFPPEVSDNWLHPSVFFRLHVTVTQLGGKRWCFLFCFEFCCFNKATENHGCAWHSSARWLGRVCGKHQEFFSSLSWEIHSPPALCKVASRLGSLGGPDSHLFHWPLSRRWDLLSSISRSEIRVECGFTQPWSGSRPEVITVTWAGHGDPSLLPVHPMRGPFCCHHSIKGMSTFVYFWCDWGIVWLFTSLNDLH